MGIPKNKAGIASLAAFKKDKLSWDAVIKKARMYQLGPDKVGALLDKFYEDDLYRGFSIQTFVIVAMYKDRLSKLKKGEKPYAAQSWILRHYPGLVDLETIKLSKLQRTKPKYKTLEIREKLRSKRNIILNKFKRMKGHPNFDKFYRIFYRAKNIQKTIKEFYVR